MNSINTRGNPYELNMYNGGDHNCQLLSCHHSRFLNKWLSSGAALQSLCLKGKWVWIRRKNGAKTHADFILKSLLSMCIWIFQTGNAAGLSKHRTTTTKHLGNAGNCPHHLSQASLGYLVERVDSLTVSLRNEVSSLTSSPFFTFLLCFVYF